MAQVDEAIDFNRIKQHKVRDFLKKNGFHYLNDLANLRSTCFNPDDGNQYHRHVKKYLIQAEINLVWQTYKTIPPEETWNGEMVSFGMMYSRKSNSVSFVGDAYNGLDKGQILFMNLNLFNIAHLAVGHEIMEVSDEEKCIKICYLQNGASTGTQNIQLQKLNNNQTEVIHETWYRSGSLLRDKLLYPAFHSKAISEFHTAIKYKVEASVSL